MNKKGFTLIELMVSIALLSIVLVFMMNTLIKLRDTSLASGTETNLLVGQAIISKTINGDILKHDGISSYSGCNTNTITLTLGDGNIRTLSLNEATGTIEEKTVLTYNTETESIMTRKVPLQDNGSTYQYGSFACSNKDGLTKIVVTIKDNSKYNSEILYYKAS